MPVLDEQMVGPWAGKIGLGIDNPFSAPFALSLRRWRRRCRHRSIMFLRVRVRGRGWNREMQTASPASEGEVINVFDTRID
jgi:hypothetical protein